MGDGMWEKCAFHDGSSKNLRVTGFVFILKVGGEVLESPSLIKLSWIIIKTAPHTDVFCVYYQVNSFPSFPEIFVPGSPFSPLPIDHPFPIG